MCTFIEAIEDGLLDIVKQYTEDQKLVPTVTHMDIACSNDQMEIIKFLLTFFPSSILRRQVIGKLTLLGYLLRKKEYTLTISLLDKNFHFDVETQENVIEHANLDVIKFIYELFGHENVLELYNAYRGSYYKTEFRYNEVVLNALKDKQEDILKYIADTMGLNYIRTVVTNNMSNNRLNNSEFLFLYKTLPIPISLESIWRIVYRSDLETLKKLFRLDRTIEDGDPHSMISIIEHACYNVEMFKCLTKKISLTQGDINRIINRLESWNIRSDHLQVLELILSEHKQMISISHIKQILYFFTRKNSDGIDFLRLFEEYNVVLEDKEILHQISQKGTRRQIDAMLSFLDNDTKKELMIWCFENHKQNTTFTVLQEDLGARVEFKYDNQK
jgi:hypothetical protein